MWETYHFLTQINRHGDEDDDPEPDVEVDWEVYDCDGDVHDGGQDGEDQVWEERVDGVCPPVHDPEDLSGLSSQVPPEAQRVKVAEQTNLYMFELEETFEKIKDISL